MLADSGHFRDEGLRLGSWPAGRQQPNGSVIRERNDKIFGGSPCGQCVLRLGSCAGIRTDEQPQGIVKPPGACWTNGLIQTALEEAGRSAGFSGRFHDDAEKLGSGGPELQVRRYLRRGSVQPEIARDGQCLRRAMTRNVYEGHLHGDRPGLSQDFAEKGPPQKQHEGNPPSRYLRHVFSLGP